MGIQQREELREQVNVDAFLILSCLGVLVAVLVFAYLHFTNLDTYHSSESIWLPTSNIHDYGFQGIDPYGENTVPVPQPHRTVTLDKFVQLHQTDQPLVVWWSVADLGSARPKLDIFYAQRQTDEAGVVWLVASETVQPSYRRAGWTAPDLELAVEFQPGQIQVEVSEQFGLSKYLVLVAAMGTPFWALLYLIYWLLHRLDR